jgi:hypothetical protein
MNSKLPGALFGVGFLLQAAHYLIGSEALGYIALAFLVASGVAWLAASGPRTTPTSVGAPQDKADAISPLTSSSSSSGGSNTSKVLMFGGALFVSLFIVFLFGHDPSMTAKTMGELTAELFWGCAIPTFATAIILRKPGASWLKVGAVFVGVTVSAFLIYIFSKIPHS